MGGTLVGVMPGNWGRTISLGILLCAFFTMLLAHLTGFHTHVASLQNTELRRGLSLTSCIGHSFSMLGGVFGVVHMLLICFTFWENK